MSNARNVFGVPLETCAESPLTGFIRSGGRMRDGTPRPGPYTLCARVTKELLDATHAIDLS